MVWSEVLHTFMSHQQHMHRTCILDSNFHSLNLYSKVAKLSLISMGSQLVCTCHFHHSSNLACVAKIWSFCQGNFKSLCTIIIQNFEKRCTLVSYVLDIDGLIIFIMSNDNHVNIFYLQVTPTYNLYMLENLSHDLNKLHSWQDLAIFGNCCFKFASTIHFHQSCLMSFLFSLDEN